MYNNNCKNMYNHVCMYRGVFYVVSLCIISVLLEHSDSYFYTVKIIDPDQMPKVVSNFSSS